MSKLTQVSSQTSFGGVQSVHTHQSALQQCTMQFGVYLPPQAKTEKVPCLLWLSGLTCTEQNFVTKAGAQRAAAELGMAIICPDTSPRGDDVADDEAYDLGKGAGFYLTATEAPWSAHFKMDAYILDELMPQVESAFPVNGKWSISGHSMGGHGALTMYLKNSERFRSCSAFSPIVAPSEVPWGQKALTAYLGEKSAAWDEHDASVLVKKSPTKTKILIDQGLDDQFLAEQLQPEIFEKACEAAGQPCKVRRQEGYDHSYYFIASFVEDHLRHASAHF